MSFNYTDQDNLKHNPHQAWLERNQILKWKSFYIPGGMIDFEEIWGPTPED